MAMAPKKAKRTVKMVPREIGMPILRETSCRVGQHEFSFTVTGDTSGAIPPFGKCFCGMYAISEVKGAFASAPRSRRSPRQRITTKSWSTPKIQLERKDD